MAELTDTELSKITGGAQGDQISGGNYTLVEGGVYFYRMFKYYYFVKGKANTDGYVDLIMRSASSSTANFSASSSCSKTVANIATTCEFCGVTTDEGTFTAAATPASLGIN